MLYHKVRQLLMTTANYTSIENNIIESEQTYTMADGILASAIHDDDLVEMCLENVDRIMWLEDQTAYTFDDASTIIIVLH